MNITRRNTYTSNELALAYELRQEGCSWKCIARGIGGNAESIRNAVLRVIRIGLK